MATVSITTSARDTTIPWYVWFSILAVSSAMIGAHWDISWHRSIGRDTFWTPAHIAIYFCGVLAGLTCGYLILSRTFARAFADASVSVWGLRGPLGAFIAAWGGVAMLTSAPFDDWWHSAYGLDVKILSPPHVVLAIGLVSIELGALILILGNMNRAQGRVREKLNWCFLYVAAMLVIAMLVLMLEYTARVQMHNGQFYRVISLVVPGILAGVAKASKRRWAATTVTGIYSISLLGLLWILPLFPAEPKLGPVYQKVTHFIPAGFPLLLIVPAMALDFLWSPIEGWNKWLQAAVSGLVFLGVFVAVQWPFANFLMSPAARNWVFGSHYFDYATRPTSLSLRHIFMTHEPSGLSFRTEIVLAAVAAILTTRLGLAWGSWMQRIRR